MVLEVVESQLELDLGFGVGPELAVGLLQGSQLQVHLWGTGLVTYNHVWAGPHEQAPEPVNKELCQERKSTRKRCEMGPEIQDHLPDLEGESRRRGDSLYPTEVQSQAKPPVLADVEGNKEGHSSDRERCGEAEKHSLAF